MGISIDGKPVSMKYFAEWALDLFFTFIGTAIVWSAVAPDSVTDLGGLGFPLAITAATFYGLLKLTRWLKWIDK